MLDIFVLSLMVAAFLFPSTTKPFRLGSHMKPQIFNYFNIVLMSLIESLFKCSFNAVELPPFFLCLNLKMEL
jgi:hypothetical protein